MPHVAHVSHRKSGISTQHYHAVLRRAPAYHHADVPAPESFFHFAEPLQHEAVMPQISLRIAVRYSKINYKVLIQPFCLIYSIYKGVVVLCPLRALHPVNHIGTVLNLLLIQKSYALRLYHASSLSQPLHTSTQPRD